MDEIPLSIEISLLEIESTLVYWLRPHFLSIQYNNDTSPFIHIIVSHPKFNKLRLAQRIHSVFELIKEHNPDIIEKEIPLVIETFDDKELGDLIEYATDFPY